MSKENKENSDIYDIEGGRKGIDDSFNTVPNKFPKWFPKWVINFLTKPAKGIVETTYEGPIRKHGSESNNWLNEALND